MATDRICTDTLTVFNCLGRDADRRDHYQATVLHGTHNAASIGPVTTSQNSADAMKTLLFDEKIQTPSGRQFADAVRFAIMSRAEQSSHWTLRTDGRDYIAPGEHATDDQGHLPEGVRLYRVSRIARHLKGSRGLHFTTIEAL